MPDGQEQPQRDVSQSVRRTRRGQNTGPRSTQTEVRPHQPAAQNARGLLQFPGVAVGVALPGRQCGLAAVALLAVGQLAAQHGQIPWPGPAPPQPSRRGRRRRPAGAVGVPDARVWAWAHRGFAGPEGRLRISRKSACSEAQSSGALSTSSESAFGFKVMQPGAAARARGGGGSRDILGFGL